MSSFWRIGQLRCLRERTHVWTKAKGIKIAIIEQRNWNFSSLFSFFALFVSFLLGFCLFWPFLLFLTVFNSFSLNFYARFLKSKKPLFQNLRIQSIVWRHLSHIFSVNFCGSLCPLALVQSFLYVLKYFFSSF